MNIGKNFGEMIDKSKDMVSNIDFDPNKRIEQFKDSITETIKDIFDPDSRLSDVKDYLKDYETDLKERIEFPDLLKGLHIDSNNLEIMSPEQVKDLRKEFNNDRVKLRSEWEKVNGLEWPKYKEDIYDVNGSLIRRKGDSYDAHHIQPLSLGGKNEASNIVPIHVLEHYDHVGVHDINSPLSRVKNIMKGE